MEAEFQWTEVLSLIQEKINEISADSAPLIQKQKEGPGLKTIRRGREGQAELYWMALDKVTGFLTTSFYGSEIYSDEGWTVNNVELQIKWYGV